MKAIIVVPGPAFAIDEGVVAGCCAVLGGGVDVEEDELLGAGGVAVAD